MITLYVHAFGTGEFGDYKVRHIDATPWFAQATRQQILRLEKEYFGPDFRNSRPFYAGEQTDDIFGWMSEHHPDRGVQDIIAFCDLTDCGWNCELNAEEVRAYLRQKAATEVAHGAVDKLLGGV